MTNEEAIKRLKSDIYKYSDFTENPNENEFWTAFDMAIKALEQEPKTDIWSIKDVANTFKKHGLIREQEPCEDAISRQAVLDGLASIAKAKAKSDEQKALMGRVMFFTEQLPPVAPQPKTGHWSRKTKVDAYDIAGVKTWGIKCQCDRCDFTTIVVEDFGYYKYCPNCGARMAESEDKE